MGKGRGAWIGVAAVLAVLALSGQAAAAPARHAAKRPAPERTYRRPGQAPPPAPAAPAAAPATAACDRACLGAHLDKVLQAMADHVPAAAGLAAGARYTENGQALAPGEGLWRSMGAAAMQGDGLSSLGVVSPAYRLYFADVADAQAGYLGSVTEAGKPAVLLLRVKVKDGKAAEVEAIVARQGSAGVPLQPRAFTAPEPGLLAVDGTQARSALVGAVNRYFEAMRGQAGEPAPLSATCIRRENGQAFGCAPQPVSAIREGRVMLADVDRGLVLIQAMLDRSFTGTEPSTQLAVMLFKFRAGQIVRIEGLALAAALGSGSGWTD